LPADPLQDSDVAGARSHGGSECEENGDHATDDAVTTFSIGDLVQIHGLQSDAGAWLNGQHGRIVGRNEATGRWCVSFQGSAEGKQLKECNLRLAAGAEPLAGSTFDGQGCLAAEDGVTMFSIGDLVQIHGLESDTGARLNGQRGSVTGRNEATGRWCVRLQDSAEGKQLKDCNLRPAPDAGPHVQSTFEEQRCHAADDEITTLSIGDLVQIHSLQSESGARMNGQRGRIVGRNEATGRWHVSLQGSAQIKQLKQCNLHPVLDTNGASAAVDRASSGSSKTTGEDQRRPDCIEVVGAGEHDANGIYVWTASTQRYHKDSGRGDGDYYTVNPPGVKESESRASIGYCPPGERAEMEALVRLMNQGVDEEESRNLRGWTLRLLSQRGNSSDLYVAPGGASASPPHIGWECSALSSTRHQPAPTLRFCYNAPSSTWGLSSSKF